MKGKFAISSLRQASALLFLYIVSIVGNISYSQSPADAGVKQTRSGTPLIGSVATYNTGGILLSSPFLPSQGGGSITAQFIPDGNSTTTNYLQNVITLSLIEESASVIPQGFTATVTYNLSYGPNSTSLTTVSNQQLTVVYNGSTPGAPYKSKDYITFAGAAYVTVNVVSVNITFANQGGTSFDATAFLKLSDEIRATSYYQLTTTTTQPITLTVDPNFTPLAAPAVDDAYPVVWQQTSTGVGLEYNYTQLEWTWLDDELMGSYPNNGTYVNASAMEQLFRNNNTRLDLPLSTTSYDIPLLYQGTGVLYIRIRPINIDPSGSISFGPWTTPLERQFSGHNPNLNWQATTTYAEDGLRKSVVQYYDGSLRSRQTVTKDNTTNTTVVAETFYDYQGRPAVQILPAPTINNVIAYTQNLNLFNGQTPNNDPAMLFDMVPSTGSTSDNGAPLLVTSYPGSPQTGGSSLYYSPQNSELTTNLNNLLPDAAGYPYSITRYTPDATGRIMSQGGVGQTMQQGSGHDSKYYYGVAPMEELDGLFGTEVGVNTHYFKNMVQDANGQMSVSYVDMHGRTIATALAGNSPGNLQQLDYSNQADYATGQSPGAIQENLLGSNNSGNILKGNSLESVSTILVSQQGPYSFSYTLAAPTVPETDCSNTPLCYDCMYNLEISVSDESGQNAPWVWDFNNVQLTTNGQCTNPAMTCTTVSPPFPYTISGNTININITSLPIGSYAVRKTLTLSQSSWQNFQQQYVQSATCQTEQQIINTVFTSISGGTNGCNVASTVTPCQACLNAIGTQTSFVNAYLLSEGITNQSNATTQQLAAANAQYTAAVQHCQNVCGTYNISNPISNRLLGIQSAMLADMQPYSGQYATAPVTSLLNPGFGVVNYGSMYYKYNIFAGSASASTFPPGGSSSGTATGLYQQPYYLYPQNGSTPIASFNSYSPNAYYDASGNPDASITPIVQGLPVYTTLNATTPDGFTQLFQQSWESSLLPYHPEFQKLKFAMQNLTGTYAWLEQAFEPVSSYASAISNQYTTSTENFVTGPVGLDPYFTVNTGDASVMNGFISSGNWPAAGSPSLWQTAYNSVMCKTITNQTSQTACEEDNTHQTYDAIFGSVTGDQADQIWTVFKGLYMVAREQLVNAYINTHVSLPSTGGTPDDQLLIQQNYILHFPSSAAQIEQEFGWANLMAATDPTDANTAQQNGSNGGDAQSLNAGVCAEYVPDWQNELIQCPAIANQGSTAATNPIIIQIVQRLQALCQATTNASNPFGASTMPGSTPTVAGSTTMPNGDFSFEQIINSVLQANSINISSACNPYNIQNPKPYNAGPQYTKNVTSSVSSCMCTEYANLLKLVYPGGVTTVYLQDINSYLKGNNYSDTITAGLFAGLQNCSSLTPTTSCSYNSSQAGYTTLNNPPFGITYSALNNLLGTPNTPNYQTIIFANDTYFFPGFAQEQVGPDWEGFSNSGVDFCNYNIQHFQQEPSSSTPTNNNEDFYLTVNGYPSFIATTNELTQRDPGTYPQDSYYMACPISTPSPFTCTTTQPTPINLPDPQPLPYFLECGYTGGPQCLTCATLSNYISSFKTAFNNDPSKVAPILNPTPQQVPYNVMLQNYLNFETGMNYTWLQYFSAAKGVNCNLVADSSNASQLQNVICPNTQPLDNPTGLLVPNDPCAANMNMAINIGTQMYLAQVQALNTQFQNDYISKCLPSAQSIETFTVTFTNTEYHYTLYYYDMAGNLVKTVPPKGVHPNFSSTNITNVENAKANFIATGSFSTGLPAIILAHTLTTNYRYNSLNQVIAQNTPDAATSNFWYDALGRLVVSQNAKQAGGNASLYSYSGAQYSYTQYDALGRITQVGQLTQSQAMSQSISQDNTQLPAWINTGLSTGGEQITLTVYDNPYTPVVGLIFNQHNLRNRVSYVQFYNKYADLNNGYVANATYYTYDPHGNVDTLIQDYGTSATSSTQNVMNYTGGVGGNRWKRIVYDYDLISGKVNMVCYQPKGPGSSTLNPDAFYHRYQYDAENRIINVFTSADSVHWEREANYSYYKHGPLAQIILGQLQVQGLTYAYTLQGWLKGINPAPAQYMTPACQEGTALDALSIKAPPEVDNTLYTARRIISFEVGYDNNGKKVDASIQPVLTRCAPNLALIPALLPDDNTVIPASQFNLSLNYFDNDYQAIGGNTTLSTNYGSLLPADNSLYNGNISSMLVNINQFNQQNANSGLLYSYGYDQLNRLVSMNAFNFTIANTGASLTSIPDYQERAAYDPNGNINTYNRYGNSANGTAASLIDQLTYNYNANTNQLNYINDQQGATHTGMGDIGTQNANNYTYDAIGNLTADGTTAITWTLYGKIHSVTKGSETITYTYDVAGNRISKAVNNGSTTVTTWYVRDASGNVMSIYSAGGGTGAINGGDLTQTEIPIYGSSRLGEYKPNVDVQNTASTTNPTTTVTLPDGTTVVVHSSFTRGLKSYELSNHLGNVLVTVSDEKADVDLNHDGVIDYYTAVVISAQDYYPFGMLEPGRQFTAANATAYRYGFNGQEKSYEIDPNGNLTTAEFWEYDSRIGRRWNVDPVTKTWESPYVAFSDNPIIYCDILGNTDSSFAKDHMVDKKGREVVGQLQTVTVSRAYHTKEELIDAYTAGVSNAFISDNAFGFFRKDPDEMYSDKYLKGEFVKGQITGDLAAIATGGAENTGGLVLAEKSAEAGIASSETVVGGIAGLAGAGTGLLVSWHGRSVIATATANLIIARVFLTNLEANGNLNTSGSNSKVSELGITETADRIGNGHAWDKHVIDGGEFPDIANKDQFKVMVDNIMKSTSSLYKQLARGREAWWDAATGTVVIRDPNSVDLGTAFRPTRGVSYFNNLK